MQFQKSAAALDSPFMDPPTPIVLARSIQSCLLQLVNDAQVLLYQNPAAVRYLSHWSREFRSRLAAPIIYLVYPEDTMAQPPQTPPDPATLEAAQRLIDAIHLFAPIRPRALQIVEQCVTDLIADQSRHRIWERVQRLTPKNVVKLEAVVQRLEAEQEDAARHAAE